MSLRGDIFVNLANRLRSITTANGYSTDVVKVYGDSEEKIPIGIELPDDDLPAILLVDNTDEVTLEHRQTPNAWEIELQLVHKGSLSDLVMMDFVRDIYKAIFANSPTAERVDGFRGPYPGGIHESITLIKPLTVTSDLNMIEANRIYFLTFLIQYRTRLYNF